MEAVTSGCLCCHHWVVRYDDVVDSCFGIVGGIEACLARDAKVDEGEEQYDEQGKNGVGVWAKDIQVHYDVQDYVARSLAACMDDDGGGGSDDEDDAYLDEKVVVHDRVPYPLGAVVEDASRGKEAPYPYCWIGQQLDYEPCV